MKIPPLHILIYGEPFVGKSYFNSTMPNPHLVFCFDPVGKDVPYLQAGLVQDANEDGTPLLNQVGCQMKRVWKDGKLLIQVEYFRETEWTVDNATGGLKPIPKAFNLWCKRMVTVNQDCEYFKTISLDSLTYFEIAIRLREKYLLNPTAKTQQLWYGAARQIIEETVLSRLSSLPTNVVIVCHEMVKEIEATKELLRGVNVVGQLAKTMPTGFPEMYRMRFDPLKNLRYLQTVSDINWPANSEFAPNPCQPDYQSVIASLGDK